MKALPYILLLILLGVLFLVYTTTESGHERELLKLKKKHYYAMDSLSKRAEMWRKAALQYGDQFRKEAGRALQSEQRLSYALEENRILKRKVIRYSNSQLDSIFVRYK